MFIVTIEQEVDDDFFGHWELKKAYILAGTFPVRAMYEALHRWIKAFYHGSTHECLGALNIDDRTLRVTVSYGFPPGTLRQVYQERFIPLDHWAGGRCTNSKPVHCAICGWYGAVRQMYHGYTLNSRNEVEPLDRCPECNAALQ